MADLIITQAVLEESTAKLQHISAELEHLKSDERELAQVYGQRDLQKAMHDFSGDWRVHRDKMKGAVKDLATKMQQATDEWTSREKELADALSTEEEPTRNQSTTAATLAGEASA